MRYALTRSICVTSTGQRQRWARQTNGLKYKHNALYVAIENVSEVTLNNLSNQWVGEVVADKG